MKYWISAVIAAVAFTQLGCNGGKDQTNIEVITNMMDQESIKSQDWYPADGDKVQMRMPPKGAVARGHAPYAFADDPEGAGREKNPLAGNASPEVLQEGRKQYDIYCAVCHGATGNGEGSPNVMKFMAMKPRNLLLAPAKAYTDGHINYVITMGFGLMGSYATQITDANKRWAVVNYVRSLQNQAK